MKLEFSDLHIGFQETKKSKLLFSTGNLMFNLGEFVGLIGPNGSGKTTFFDVLMGFQKALSGKIVIDGKLLPKIPSKDKMKLLSYVPSKFEGVNNLSVYDLISLGRSPYTNFIHQLSSNDHQIVKNIIEQMELSHLKDRNTLLLSDGERQIAMIGKALAQQTPIIVLDEPTAFLDYKNRDKVVRLLKNIASDQKKIIFISSHDLSLCFKNCSRIIGINESDKQMIDFPDLSDNNMIIQSIFPI